MEWIGCTVCEIFAFKLYCDLETGVLCHSRLSNVALFESIEHIQLHIVFHSNYASVYYRFWDIAAYWSKIATLLVFGAPVGDEAVRFEQQPLVANNQNDEPITVKEFRWYVQPFWHKACVWQTDRIAVAYTRYSIYAIARKNQENLSMRWMQWTITDGIWDDLNEAVRELLPVVL